MSKRQSLESRVVEYFEAAPLAEARLVLGIAQRKIKVRERLEGAGETGVAKVSSSPRKRTHRAPRLGKAAYGGEAGQSAPFGGETVEVGSKL